MTQTTFTKGDLVFVPRHNDVPGKAEPLPSVNKAKIMTTCDGYAMVRFKGAMPFVVSLKDLEKIIGYDKR